MRGRKRKTDKTVPKKIYIPTSIVQRIDEVLEDPVLKKPPLGAWSNLTVQLLREFIRSLDRPIVPTDDEFLAALRTVATDDYELWRDAMQALTFELMKKHGYGKSLDYMAKVASAARSFPVEMNKQEDNLK